MLPSHTGKLQTSVWLSMTIAHWDVVRSLAAESADNGMEFNPQKAETKPNPPVRASDSKRTNMIPVDEVKTEPSGGPSPLHALSSDLVLQEISLQANKVTKS